jgi:hypothetical protein
MVNLRRFHFQELLIDYSGWNDTNINPVREVNFSPDTHLWFHCMTSEVQILRLMAFWNFLSDILEYFVTYYDSYGYSPLSHWVRTLFSIRVTFGRQMGTETFIFTFHQVYQRRSKGIITAEGSVCSFHRGRNHWKSNRSVARPLRTEENTHTHTKTDTHPCILRELD